MAQNPASSLQPDQRRGAACYSAWLARGPMLCLAGSCLFGKAPQSRIAFGWSEAPEPEFAGSVQHL